MTSYKPFLIGVGISLAAYGSTELPSLVGKTLRMNVGEVNVCIGKQCQEENTIDVEKKKVLKGKQSPIEQKVVMCNPVREEVIIEKCSAEKENKLYSLERSLDRCENKFEVNRCKVKTEDSLVIAYARNINGMDYKFPIRVSDYLRYKTREHHHVNIGKMVNYVTYNDIYIKDAAQMLTQKVGSKEEKAKFILDFVHQQMYDVSIEQDRNYVKYPLETLVERNGDCEDLAILGAALLKAIDINVALLHYEGKKGGDGHMAIGVEGNFDNQYYDVDGTRYFYAEATGTEWLSNQSTWKIGMIPEEYKKQEAFIYVVR